MSVTKIEQKREKKLDGNHIYRVEKTSTPQPPSPPLLPLLQPSSTTRQTRAHTREIHSGKINRNKMKWK